MATLIALFFGTFVAEDLTALAAGVLVRQGRVDLLPALLATALGIYVGDLGLWLAGRFAAARLRRFAWFARWAGSPTLESFGDFFNRRAAVLVCTSRLLPGSRLPLYLAAGAAGGTWRSFATWSAVAVAVWTPALVLAGATAPVVALAMGGFLLARPLVVRIWRSRHVGPRLVAIVSRLWRWEFWPMWLFYAPVAVWVMWLAVRHRGFGAITAANPGIPDAGIVGESKYDILRRLPREWVIPSCRLGCGTAAERMTALEREMTGRGWRFPLVLKPDVGQRGTGVRVVHSTEHALAYLGRERGDVLVQPFHEGPHEAGIFYYRMPSWPRGLILSITDKRFPVVLGDGRSTVEDLIWSHPRLRMQARTFLARHRGMRGRIPAAGEALILARAGNHAQGTMFLDGSAMITPALESRIDAIARAYPGFFVGRFDVRYRDREAFLAGRDLAVVELNGATAEATNIYDPSRSLWSAYRTLFFQWQLVFAIGAENRARGTAVSSPWRLAALVTGHLLSKPAHAVSD